MVLRNVSKAEIKSIVIADKKLTKAKCISGCDGVVVE